MKFRINQVNELIEVLNNSDFGTIEVDEGDFKVTLSKTAVAAQPQPQHHHVIEVFPDDGGAPSSTPDYSGDQLPPSPGETVVHSTLVGRVRLTSAEGRPFAKVESEVQAGHVICVIEALKQEHEVVAPIDGTIEALCVEDGDIVEYGQPLFTIG